MPLRVRELAPWGGSAALLLEGGSERPERPPVHLQAAMGGYLRLVGAGGPLLWGLVDRGRYGVTIVRAKGATIQTLAPIRVGEAERAPGASHSVEFLSWWTRHYAALLCDSTNAPLSSGRSSLLAPLDVREWAFLRRSDRLEALLAQGEEFELNWDVGYVGLLLTRELSDSDDGRVKMWRKRAREGTLPPLLVWWCDGLYTHVMLDGHDRVHAALLEDVKPDAIVLANVTPNARADVEERKRTSIDHAAFLESVPSPENRARAVNTVLRAAWDPRAAWDQATPGFPLDGGVERWEEEVGGTALEEALRHQRSVPDNALH